jgi:hypothetical protein
MLRSAGVFQKPGALLSEAETGFAVAQALDSSDLHGCLEPLQRGQWPFGCGLHPS